MSTRDVGAIIKKIIHTFADVNLEQLPKKSVMSNMLLECECLGKIQAAETILQGSNNTLHLGGTCKVQ